MSLGHHQDCAQRDDAELCLGPSIVIDTKRVMIQTDMGRDVPLGRSSRIAWQSKHSRNVSTQTVSWSKDITSSEMSVENVSV